MTNGLTKPFADIKAQDKSGKIQVVLRLFKTTIRSQKLFSDGTGVFASSIADEQGRFEMTSKGIELKFSYILHL